MEAYITAVEQASSKLPVQETDEVRSDVSHLLRQHHTQHKNQCNLNPIQCKALTQLKQDTSRVVLTADKGVAMVIIDQQDYINKTNMLLQDIQHIQSAQKGSHQQPQKQINSNTQGKQTNRRPQQHQIQTDISHQCSLPQILWPSQNS